MFRVLVLLVRRGLMSGVRLKRRRGLMSGVRGVPRWLVSGVRQGKVTLILTPDNGWDAIRGDLAGVAVNVQVVERDKAREGPANGLYFHSQQIGDAALCLIEDIVGAATIVGQPEYRAVNGAEALVEQGNARKKCELAPWLSVRLLGHLSLPFQMSAPER